MTRKEADAKIADLNEKKVKLEQSLAVLTSDLGRQNEKLDEISAKVEEIVGSTDIESVKEYLSNLENEISLDIDKLNEMEN